MKQYFILLSFLLISNLSTNDKISSKDLRDCNISEKLLNEGLVKKLQLTEDNKVNVFYDEIKRQGNYLLTKRYNDSFQIIREEKYHFTNDCLILVEKSQSGTNRIKYKLEIIKPNIISYNPENKILESITSYNPTDEYTFKTFEKRQLVNKLYKEYQNNRIKCIRYDHEIIFSAIEQATLNIVDNTTFEGYSLFGKNIGWFYSEFKKNESGSLIFELTDILTISEFEKQKL